jgi:hypothetical protein
VVEEADELAPTEEDLSSIHGTATCLPEVLAVPMPLLGEVEVELVELLLVEPRLLPRDNTANSSLPEPGLMIVSLIVPISLPEEDITCAPVNWLPRTASCPIRPVALKCLPDQPDWLLELP